MRRPLPPSPLLGSLAAGLLACLAACSQTPPADDSAQPISYRHDTVAVLDRYCTTCHTAGGIAPFALTDYESAKNNAALIKASVQSGRMPPWMPSEHSMPLRYSRAMRPEDRDLLVRWIDSGTPEGTADQQPRRDIPPAETVAAPRPDLVADPGFTYQPDTSHNDDYHCFVVDPKLTTDTFLRAATVVPGNRAIVHHVLAFEIRADAADGIRKLDQGGKGYTCFGGPGGGGRPQTLFGWAPGGVPIRLGENSGLRIHQGSLLVLQIHYNTLANNGQGDRSVAQLELDPTPPAHEIYVVPVANPKQLKIAAGDANAKQQVSFPVAWLQAFAGLPGGDLTIVGNALHMHLLGKRIVTAIGDKTMVEIPRWDFHWQQSYVFTTPIVAHSSDSIQLECDYDNSFANQPLVNGMQLPPRDVTWGESTLDEMCLSFLSVTPTTP